MAESSQSNENPSAAAAALFAASAAYFARRLRRSDAEERRRRADLAASLPPGVTGRVSRRGESSLVPPLPYADALFRCLDDPCHPTTNPAGHIALCVAENGLVTDVLARRLQRPGTVSSAFSDSAVFCYNGFLGLPAARVAAARFLERRFLFRPDAGGGGGAAPDGPAGATGGGGGGGGARGVSPGHVSLGSGCSSLLNYLSYCLAEEGDAVLIPAPYFAAFETDLKAIAGCVAFPVHMANPLAGPTTEDLDEAARKAEKNGLCVKILLLTNPHNPLGVIYEPQVVANSVMWARSRRMHTILDEIYALSVHKKNHGFQSIVQILDNRLGNDVHMLWALSKDFGASGFRIGVLYTQNNIMLQALANLNIFSGVSHPMQMIMAEVLTDDAFVDAFLDDARIKISRSYAICARKLEEMVIPYIPAEAGIFVYCDFSSLLPSQDYEGERRFSELVQNAARVVMTPGQSQRDRKPGMMRICYTWVTAEVLEIAMERLSRLAAKIRKIGWEDLDPLSLNVII